MLGIGKRVKNYIRKRKYLKNQVYVTSTEDINRDLKVESPISIGNNTIIYKNVSIGRYSYITSGVIYSGTQIGRFCSIAANTLIGAEAHPTNWLSTSPFQYGNGFIVFGDFKSKTQFCNRKETVIGNDVWIGGNATILGGVTIGDGAVIGAGSVVTKDVPPYSIVVGAPAKLLKFRFDEETIEELLKSNWWDKDISELDGLPYDNVHECLERLNGLVKN